MADLTDYKKEEILPKMVDAAPSPAEPQSYGTITRDNGQVVQLDQRGYEEFESARRQYNMVREHYGQTAENAVTQMFNSLKRVGVSGQTQNLASDSIKSKLDLLADGPTDDGMPKTPGFAYMSHLLRRTKDKIKAKKQELKKQGKEPPNIYTDHMEALKVALQAMGVYSDKNPGGMPIELKDARKIWFGNEELDGIKEAEWRSLVEMGDRNIDPKKVRKFTNYDGSITWEILNDDKTVSSRFTMGEFAGTKIFTQGGYTKFADLLKEVKQKAGSSGEFESIRGMFAR